ncbi:MAG: PspC domain-containing protein [Thermotogae bacterium]|nr:PspC domain-containing protein [Thermotogota bacterium]
MYKKLCRSRKDKKLGGVCGGIAEYLSVDPTLIRIIFIVLMITWGSGILVYLLLWLLLPECSSEEAKVENSDYTYDEKKGEWVEKARDNAPLIVGITLTVIGILVLTAHFIPHFSVSLIWAIALIIFGIYLIFKR